MILAALIFIILGALIKYGKMYNLIAGYNTMSKEEKANYDLKGIAILMRNVLFTMAFILIAGQAAAWWFNYPKFQIFFTMIIVLVGITYLLIKIKSNKFKINKD